ncbi:MAG: glycosyltransferase [Eubacterium sp.]|nr:glycosyltransferase [Eubacterium sp.]
MIKILFLIHDLGVGGAEKVLVNLVNNMDCNRFDITVISLFGGGINEKFINPNIRLINAFNKTIRGNSKIMKIFTPEFLHDAFVKDTYDIEVAYLEGPCARIISGCSNPETKLVAWIHGELNSLNRIAKSFRSKKETLRCYNKFDQINFVSESVKEDFCKFVDLSNKTEVIHNTVESETIIRASHQPVSELKSEDINIVSVGKLSKRKGYDRMLNIIKKLFDEGYPIHFYALGVGEYEKEMRKIIKERKMDSYFTLLGYQTNPYKYVRRADLFVCASLAEGFSTAATEALILGVPVITTLVSGMKEMLGNNNEYGIITNNDEKSLYEGIKKLLDNPELLKHYKSQAQKRGEDFITKRTVNATQEMFISLL